MIKLEKKYSKKLPTAVLGLQEGIQVQTSDYFKNIKNLNEELLLNIKKNLPELKKF